jgi:hypothetical protein
MSIIKKILGDVQLPEVRAVVSIEHRTLVNICIAVVITSVIIIFTAKIAKRV